MSDFWVNGYLIVLPRRPGETYQGADRSPWDPIDDGFFKGTLPERIRTAYNSIRLDSSRGHWWPTCRDLSTAAIFVEYLREVGQNAEVIAVYSPYLAQSQDRKGWSEPMSRPLGVDVVAVGEWSLLRVLLESRDAASSDLVNLVNKSGLLFDASCARIVETRYRELAKANLVEPIASADPAIPVEAVTVYGLADVIPRRANL